MGTYEEVYGYMSYSQYVLHHLKDIGSFLGTIFGTALNYKGDPYVHF